MDKQRAAALAMADDNDNLRSARGILTGLVLSVFAIWLPALAWWWLSH